MDTSLFCLCLVLMLICASSDGQTTPGPTSNTNSTTTTNEEPHQGDADNEFANRLAVDRLFHLWNLQRHVLQSLGWNSTPPSIDPEERQRLLQRINPATFIAVQKNCYYPVCDLPSVSLPDYMNRTVWFDNCSRHARYFFHIPNHEDTGQEVTSAVVKLHLKRPQDCPCAFEDEHSNSRIHIKIYQYRKPIRSLSRLRHGNRRLVDAKVVTWDSSRWVTLQVTDAVRRIARGKRNAGFEVQIKNMEEEVLDAKTIIEPTVCSPVTEFDCTGSDGTDSDYEEINSSFSPMLIITNRISMNSQGLPEDR